MAVQRLAFSLRALVPQRQSHNMILHTCTNVTPPSPRRQTEAQTCTEDVVRPAIKAAGLWLGAHSRLLLS